MRFLLFCCVLLTLMPSARAFSALGHLAVVDSCWARGLVPVLLGRYPGSTPTELREARSYAYGGTLIQDQGYFPGNAPFFSDLTHYVRTGDFVRALFDEARDRDELAFALGALSHYAADACGHPEGVNVVTARVFPELRGSLPGTGISYAQAPREHAQVEFAFDAAQVRAGRYRSEDFHEAIGLRVSQELLARAFARTYGLALDRVRPHAAASTAVWHLVVMELLPAAVRAGEYVPTAELARRPLAEQRGYYARINSGHFRRVGRRPDHLNLQMQLLVRLVPTLPRLGIARMMAFRPLPPAAETTLRAAFAASLTRYDGLLAHLAAPLPNLNLDTGQPSRAADYSLADRTYATWLGRLAGASAAPADVLAAVRAYYQPLAPLVGPELDLAAQWAHWLALRPAPEPAMRNN